MTTQAILKKISNLESELQKLKLEAYLKLPKKKKERLSEIAGGVVLPRLTYKQIQKEIKAYRNGK